MAKNGAVGDGHRDGMVKSRSQTKNTQSGRWTKRDEEGKFMDQKSDADKFKGVRRDDTSVK